MIQVCDKVRNCLEGDDEKYCVEKSTGSNQNSGDSKKTTNSLSKFDDICFHFQVVTSNAMTVPVSLTITVVTVSHTAPTDLTSPTAEFASGHNSVARTRAIALITSKGVTVPTIALTVLTRLFVKVLLGLT